MQTTRIRFAENARATAHLVDRRPAALARLLEPDNPVLREKVHAAARTIQCPDSDLQLPREAIRYLDKLVHPHTLGHSIVHIPAEQRKQANAAILLVWNTQPESRASVIADLLRQPQVDPELVGVLLETATTGQARQLVGHVLDIASLEGSRWKVHLPYICDTVLGRALEYGSPATKGVVKAALSELGYGILIRSDETRRKGILGAKLLGVVSFGALGFGTAFEMVLLNSRFAEFIHRGISENTLDQLALHVPALFSVAMAGLAAWCAVKFYRNYQGMPYDYSFAREEARTSPPPIQSPEPNLVKG